VIGKPQNLAREREKAERGGGGGMPFLSSCIESCQDRQSFLLSYFSHSSNQRRPNHTGQLAIA